MAATFGGLVRRARLAAWLTQETLAEKSGLSIRTIQEIERDRVRRPHRESVRLLAGALGLRGSALAEFEAAARPEHAAHSGRHAGCEVCGRTTVAELIDCLAHRLRDTGDQQAIDLLGQLRGALTHGYGFTGSLEGNHTLPAQVLPGA